MRLYIALMRAAREAAAVVVAQFQRLRQPGRHDPPAALVVQQIAPRVLNELGEVGIAGDVAGIRLVDAPVGLDVVARAARRLLPGQLVAVDGQHHLVALAGASPLQGSPTARQAVLGHVHQRIGEALFPAGELECQPVREIIRFRGNTSRGIHVGHNGTCSPRGDLLAVAAAPRDWPEFPRKHRSKHPPPTIRTASAPLSRLSRQRLPPANRAVAAGAHGNRRRPRPTRPPQSCFQRHVSAPRQILGSATCARPMSSASSSAAGPAVPRRQMAASAD